MSDNLLEFPKKIERKDLKYDWRDIPGFTEEHGKMDRRWAYVPIPDWSRHIFKVK